MARPRLFYVLFNHGTAEQIVQGRTEDAETRVRQLRAWGYSAALFPCRNRLAAEELLCWHNYEREKRA